MVSRLFPGTTYELLSREEEANLIELGYRQAAIPLSQTNMAREKLVLYQSLNELTHI